MVINTFRLQEITNLDEVHLYQQMSTFKKNYSLRKKFLDFNTIQAIIKNIIFGKTPKAFYQQLLKKDIILIIEIINRYFMLLDNKPPTSSNQEETNSINTDYNKLCEIKSNYLKDINSFIFCGDIDGVYEEVLVKTLFNEERGNKMKSKYKNQIEKDAFIHLLIRTFKKPLKTVDLEQYDLFYNGRLLTPMLMKRYNYIMGEDS